MNIQAINQSGLYNNSLNKNKKVQAEPSFQGKGDFGEAIGKLYAKYYAKPMYNSMWLQKFSEKVAKIPGEYTEHMSALGSAITSSVYMKRTLDNKDLDDDKKKTLAVNQGLCFVIPTILSYYINGKLAGFNKKQEFNYSFKQEKKIANGKIAAKDLEKFNKATSERLKGFKTFSSLLTFTLIYRYASPVLITPLANKTSPYVDKFLKWMNGDKQQKAKEVQLNTSADKKSSKQVA